MSQNLTPKNYATVALMRALAPLRIGKVTLTETPFHVFDEDGYIHGQAEFLDQLNPSVQGGHMARYLEVSRDHEAEPKGAVDIRFEAPHEQLVAVAQALSRATGIKAEVRKNYVEYIRFNAPIGVLADLNVPLVSSELTQRMATTQAAMTI